MRLALAGYEPEAEQTGVLRSYVCPAYSFSFYNITCSA